MAASTIVLLVFATISLVFTGFILISRLVEGLRDNTLAIQSGPATVVSKRMLDPLDRASYGHVTFQMPDGSRQDFEMHFRDYDMAYDLEAGDRGILSWQGTRFKGFERGQNS